MKRRAARAPSLIETVDALARVYRARDPAPKDAFGLIVWENVGYLIDDARRSVLFGEFAARIGLSADAIAGARASVLLDLARRGGMRP